MATPYREGRPRTSVAWDHFEIKDREKGVATCNICHDAFSYRTSVSNLMKHLKTKHGYTIVRSEEDEGGTDTESDEKGNPQPRIKTELWEYYEVKDEEKKLATCSICLDQFSFSTSLANLFKHLKNKHSIDFGKDEFKSVEEVDDDKDETVSILTEHRTPGRNKSSVAWEYFEIRDDEKKVASCIQCGALCSYRTSVSNLMKHARRKHGVLDEDDGVEHSGVSSAIDDDSKVFQEASISRHQRSIVWLYFKCIDNESKISQCLICRKTFSHSSTLTNLKKHLARKHPNVKIPTVREDGRKRILLSSGGELYEVDTTGGKLEADDDTDDHQNDTMEMDTVFLEDFDALQDDKEEPLPKKKKTERKRTLSSSSEEEITFINRYVKKASDSFDHFGKYIASLLRSLPKEESSKLQADFVKQILSVEAKEAERTEFVSDLDKINVV